MAKQSPNDEVQTTRKENRTMKCSSMRGGFVYILTNKHNTTLYVGVTLALNARMTKHIEKTFPKSFTARYNVNKLVYYEVFDSIVTAIAREKQLKAGSRKQKENLINKYNPGWRDLFPLISDEKWDEAPLKIPSSSAP